MYNKRPKNLNLFTIKFPIPAIVSILHRVSGVLLFLLLPFAIAAFTASLSTENNFTNLKDYLSNPIIRFIIWGFLSALAYHLVAGIRHLLMDMHIGENLKTARLIAKLTIVISSILIVIMGVWLW